MQKRILTIQDISCVGQASLTVALPILSAAGHETAVLPTAVLSTHSVGFEGYTFRDLTEDMPAIADHWQREGISFDAFYSGYLGSAAQVEHVLEIADKCGRMTGDAHPLLFVDPAMADQGILYPDFDQDFVGVMGRLAAAADVLLPNITEGALLTGMAYQETYDEAYIQEMLEKLASLGGPEKTVVLTGVGYTEEETGVAVFEKGKISHIAHQKIDRICHGTGDVFASAFVGAYLNGKRADECARIATDFVYRAITDTMDQDKLDPRGEDHWYGVRFELGLPEYANRARG